MLQKLVTVLFALSMVTAGVLAMPKMPLPPKANSLAFNNIVVFGDSISDNGNGTFQSTLHLCPRSPPYFNGRFSNGPVWADYLTDMLGVPLNNLAYGAASSNYGDQSFWLSLVVEAVDGQISSYLDNNTPDCNTLYIIWAGANDLQGAANSFASDADRATLKARPATTAQYVQQDIQSLIDAGAKNIAVVNLPDIGRAPEWSSYAPSDVALMSGATQEFNSRLAGVVSSIQGARVVLLDAFSIATSIMNNPGPSGFSDVKTACLQMSVDAATLNEKRMAVATSMVKAAAAAKAHKGSAADHLKTEAAAMSSLASPKAHAEIFGGKVDQCLGSDASNACGNPDQHLFWDRIHPTTRGHKMIAQAFAQTLGKLSSNSNLADMSATVSNSVAPGRKLSDLPYVVLEGALSFMGNTTRMAFTSVANTAALKHLRNRVIKRLELPKRWQSSNRELVQWLMEHSIRGASAKSCSVAVTQGWIDVVEYLMPDHYQDFDHQGLINVAACCGHLEVLEFLQLVGLTPDKSAWDGAAKNGHLEVVQFMCKHRDHGYSCTTKAIDSAAEHGHTEVVGFMLEHGLTNCTSKAADMAASTGNLPLLQLLFKHRKRGSTLAVDLAARNDHLEVLQFLHKHRRTKGGTMFAMDFAATRGHLRIVQFLHEHYDVGCTIHALDKAAMNGHLPVVQFLAYHRHEGCSERAMHAAVKHGSLAMVEALHLSGKAECSAELLERAVRLGHLDIVAYITTYVEEDCSQKTVDTAAVSGHFHVIALLYSTRRQLPTTKAVRQARLAGHEPLANWVDKQRARLRHTLLPVKPHQDLSNGFVA
ncbi:hypothetical protein RI367_000560 [Sorochytrium milnesiophthora]